jgi:hypothetical protein
VLGRVELARVAEGYPPGYRAWFPQVRRRSFTPAGCARRYWRSPRGSPAFRCHLRRGMERKPREQLPFLLAHMPTIESAVIDMPPIGSRHVHPRIGRSQEQWVDSCRAAPMRIACA